MCQTCWLALDGTSMQEVPDCVRTTFLTSSLHPRVMLCY